MSALSAGFRSGAGQPSREHQLQIDAAKVGMGAEGNQPSVGQSIEDEKRRTVGV